MQKDLAFIFRRLLSAHEQLIILCLDIKVLSAEPGNRKRYADTAIANLFDIVRRMPVRRRFRDAID